MLRCNFIVVSRQCVFACAFWKYIELKIESHTLNQISLSHLFANVYHIYLGVLQLLETLILA